MRNLKKIIATILTITLAISCIGSMSTFGSALSSGSDDFNAFDSIKEAQDEETKQALLRLLQFENNCFILSPISLRIHEPFIINLSYCVLKNAGVNVPNLQTFVLNPGLSTRSMVVLLYYFLISNKVSEDDKRDIFTSTYAGTAKFILTNRIIDLS